MHIAGRLTAAALCQAVAALQPAGAVVVDESLTSGGSYFSVSRGCPQFSHLALTGVAAAALGSSGRAPTAKAPQIDMLRSPAPGVGIFAGWPHAVPLCGAAGGAIGAGIPLAVGAAVACPDRTVINLQASCSLMRIQH